MVRRCTGAVADMPDRIIVATALHLGLPLISRDAAIARSAAVPMVWGEASSR